MKRTIQLARSIGLMGLLFIASCNREPLQRPGADLPGLVRIGDAIITEQAFKTLLDQRAQNHPERFATYEQKRALLEELIRAEAIYAKAIATGFEKRPEIAAAIKRLIVVRFQEDQLKQAAPRKITPAAIERFYQQNAASFRLPESVMGAVIWLRTGPKMSPENRARRQAEAEAIRARAVAGEDFASLAASYSEDQATRYQGGRTGWLPRVSRHPSWDRPVVDALFTQQDPGAIAPVVEVPGGFCVVRLLERRPERTQPLAQVQDVIRQQLTRELEQQRAQAIFDEVKAGLEIQVDRALLESISVRPEPDRSPPCGLQKVDVNTP